MHFSRHLAFWSRRRGDALALSCDGDTLSWSQLDQASGALAAHLHAQGLKPGDRFGCLLGNSLEWCVAFAASLRLGSIFVPLNALFGPFELKEITADANCIAVLSTPALIAKLGITETSQHPPEQPRLYFTDGRPSQAYANIVAVTDCAFTDPGLSDDEVMIICYTSGTTGVPKGVALTHRNVDTAMQGLMLNFGLRPGGEERLLILAPLAFTGGVISNLAVVFAIGGSGWIEKTVDPARALKRILDHRITLVGGVPALWDRIAQAPGFAEADLGCLRTAYTGGAPVPRALMDTFLAKGVCIRQQYGFTEACGGVSSPSAEGAGANPGSCGHALPAMDLEIRDDAGQRITAPGEVGEIHARGGQLMSGGYWKRPEATDVAYTADGWYRTGDLASYDAQDGGLLIVDRKKNMLISGGVNIYPAEVERALARIPGVVECVVLGLHSERWGQEVAAIVYGPGLTDSSVVLETARQMLGSYKAPKHLRLSAQPLPKTASGKIARTGLAGLFGRMGI
ncbi:MAG: class I adenylate-forming enzyme family protein [Panacagrimonas sp.]